MCETPLLTTMSDVIVIKLNGTVVDGQGVEFRQWFTFNETSDFLDVQIIFPRMVLIRWDLQVLGPVNSWKRYCLKLTPTDLTQNYPKCSEWLQQSRKGTIELYHQTAISKLDWEHEEMLEMVACLRKAIVFFQQCIFFSFCLNVGQVVCYYLV